MTITSLTLKNFRCFTSATFEFSAPVTIILGDNGSGKTSLLEALHYACHLRSFRTHLPAELVADLSEYKGFNIKITTPDDEIAIGVLEKRRSIKINGSPTALYQELIAIYRVVTFIEHDLMAIQGYPESRRSLIDQALIIQDPSYYELLRHARKIVDQRTKILQEAFFHQDQYSLWTSQLISANNVIVEQRKAYLQQLNEMIRSLTHLYGADDFIRLEYRPKRIANTPADRELLMQDEVRSRRSLFGFHLDDIEFIVYDRNSRAFASRGQQKLAVMFLKIAQARLLQNSISHNKRLVFLIDDFLTDFDEVRVTKLLHLLFDLQVQLVITIPQQSPLLYKLCADRAAVNLITLATPYAST